VVAWTAAYTSSVREGRVEDESMGRKMVDWLNRNRSVVSWDLGGCGDETEVGLASPAREGEGEEEGEVR